MEKSIILVFTLSAGAMLASCASKLDTDTTTITTHQTNRQTYQLPLGRTYDPN
jgi:ABC-type glycerol-3-phosphate transport system substrate-binding protein